ncbi:MAG: hypothetical protein IIA59_04300 [Candidatus Marinimicrobia bacterium]|nr:hypothetical protein [Candidatus Neomarinimicrobiota bacterium]
MLLATCAKYPSEPGFDNPVIPGDPNYEAPQTTILSGPAEASVIDSHTVTFVWAGNRNEMQFTYQLNETSWSGWNTDTSMALQYLDEGAYTFAVKGRYISGVEEDLAVSRAFTIDDIHGPALRLYPRLKQTGLFMSNSLEIMLEEVTDVMIVAVTLSFDPAKLEVNQIEVYVDERSILKTSGGTVIPFWSIDNSAGTASVDVATVTGSPAGVSGTGAIAKIYFTAKGSGQFIISAEESSIRDPSNNEITITEFVGALVTIK